MSWPFGTTVEFSTALNWVLLARSKVDKVSDWHSQAGRLFASSPGRSGAASSRWRRPLAMTKQNCFQCLVGRALGCGWRRSWKCAPPPLPPTSRSPRSHTCHRLDKHERARVHHDDTNKPRRRARRSISTSRTCTRLVVSRAGGHKMQTSWLTIGSMPFALSRALFHSVCVSHSTCKQPATYM